MVIGVGCVLIVAVYVLWYASISKSFIRNPSTVHSITSESELEMSHFSVTVPIANDTIPHSCGSSARSNQDSGPNNFQRINTVMDVEADANADAIIQSIKPTNMTGELIIKMSNGTVKTELNSEETQVTVNEDTKGGVESSWGLVKALRVPLAFVAFFVIFFVILIIIFSRAASIQEERNVISIWGDCVLRNYNGSNGSWISECDVKPHIMLPKLAVVVLFSGQPLICAVFFAPRVITQFRILRENYLRVRE